MKDDLVLYIALMLATAFFGWAFFGWWFQS
jgi:hypothetical protein